jgi:WS/DGAT/MGAT family acyltransferase
MLAAVALVVTRRLPAGRPLWSATLINGLIGAESALVLVFHHALADGIGGLEVLGQLMDGVPTTVDPGFPRPAPRYRELAIDAFRHRMRAVRNIPAGLLSIRRAAAELGAGDSSPAPSSSINRPIGADRTLGATGVDLDAVKSAARRRGGTVNDVLLTAVAGALHTLLAERGESVDRLVISVPVSARQPGAARQLGNQVGVIPMMIPTTGDSSDRLATVAGITRDRKTHTPGASAALIGPVFRALARCGIFGWFIGHQHRVNTFVTDLAGPASEMTFAGRRVLDILAVPMITGNITIAFAALSYAGTLQISILADPGHCPDLPVALAALRREFAFLTAADAAADRELNASDAGPSRGC